MKRRNFLVLGSLLGLSPYIEAKASSPFALSFKKVEATIAAVQAHMFPKKRQTALSNTDAYDPFSLLTP